MNGNLQRFPVTDPFFDAPEGAVLEFTGEGWFERVGNEWVRVDALETMTVTVRDRTTEDQTWGHGPTNPVTVKATISAFCPRCGMRRGAPRGLNSCADGANYWVEIWDNPCGHLDIYPDVIKEARELAEKTSAGSKS